MPYTFATFQETQRPATAEEIKSIGAEDFAPFSAVRLYADCLWIIDYKDYPLNDVQGRPFGRYYLLLERDEHYSDDCEDLERKLYKYGIESGNIEGMLATPTHRLTHDQYLDKLDHVRDYLLQNARSSQAASNAEWLRRAIGTLQEALASCGEPFLPTCAFCFDAITDTDTPVTRDGETVHAKCAAEFDPPQESEC